MDEERPTWISPWALAGNSAFSKEHYNNKFNRDMYFHLNHYMQQAYPNGLTSAEWDIALVRQLRQWRVRVPLRLRAAANHVDAMDQRMGHGHHGNQEPARNFPNAESPSGSVFVNPSDLQYSQQPAFGYESTTETRPPRQQSIDPRPDEGQILAQQSIGPGDAATTHQMPPPGERRMPPGMRTSQGKYIMKTRLTGGEIAELGRRRRGDPEAQEALDSFYDAQRRNYKETPEQAPREAVKPLGTPKTHPYTVNVDAAQRQQLVERAKAGDEGSQKHLSYLRGYRRKKQRQRRGLPVTDVNHETETLSIIAPSDLPPGVKPLSKPRTHRFTTAVDAAQRQYLVERAQKDDEGSQEHLKYLADWRTENSRRYDERGRGQAATTLSEDTEKLSITAPSADNLPPSQQEVPSPPRGSPGGQVSPSGVASPTPARSPARPTRDNSSPASFTAASPRTFMRGYDRTMAEVNQQLGIQPSPLAELRSPSEAASPAPAGSSTRRAADSPSSQSQSSQRPRKAAKRTQKVDSRPSTSRGSGRGGKRGDRGGGKGGGVPGGLFGGKKH